MFDWQHLHRQSKSSAYQHQSFPYKEQSASLLFQELPTMLELATLESYFTIGVVISVALLDQFDLSEYAD